MKKGSRKGGKTKVVIKGKVKPIKAGSKNHGGDGGILVSKVLKIRKANK